jgi:hypothetical protein
MTQHHPKKIKSEAADMVEKIFPMIFASLVALLVVAVIVGLSLALNK